MITLVHSHLNPNVNTVVSAVMDTQLMTKMNSITEITRADIRRALVREGCLLYTSDAADE